MSGVNKGVQQKVRQVTPLAIYTHCCAYKLSLVLVDACKIVQDAGQFFSLLEKLYVFVSTSVVHKLWMEVQRQIHPGFPPRQLHRLSDIRWACRVVSCHNIRDRLQALVKTLRQIADGPNGG